LRVSSSCSFIRYKRNLSIAVLCFALCACLTVHAQTVEAQTTRAQTTGVDGSLVLNADLNHARVVLSPADFRALPHITVTVHNGHTNADETYSGVLLATLLAKVNAPIGKELRGEAMTSYVVATGSDGYSVVLSLAEVDPSFHEGQVLVADTRDGKPLGNNGPFQLIVPDDKRPARWVHNLTSITLQHAR
jgi:hypothetical protein